MGQEQAERELYRQHDEHLNVGRPVLIEGDHQSSPSVSSTVRPLVARLRFPPHERKFVSKFLKFEQIISFLRTIDMAGSVRYRCTLFILLLVAKMK